VSDFGVVVCGDGTVDGFVEEDGFAGDVVRVEGGEVVFFFFFE